MTGLRPRRSLYAPQKVVERAVVTPVTMVNIATYAAVRFCTRGDLRHRAAHSSSLGRGVAPISTIQLLVESDSESMSCGK